MARQMSQEADEVEAALNPKHYLHFAPDYSYSAVLCGVPADGLEKSTGVLWRGPLGEDELRCPVCLRLVNEQQIPEGLRAEGWPGV